MKRSLITAMVIFASLTQAYAEETGKKDKAVNSPERSSSDLMASMWSKISKAGKKKQASVPVAVAGLRGTEQEKANDLEPYWKGNKKEKDRAAIAEIETLVNKKDFNGAIDLISRFDTSHAESDLKPVAEMMLGYCYSQTGKKSEAMKIFEDFLKKYPGHELASDAKSGIELLREDKNS